MQIYVQKYSSERPNWQCEGVEGGAKKKQIFYPKKTCRRLPMTCLYWSALYPASLTALGEWRDSESRLEKKARNLSHPLVLDGGDLAVGVPHHGDEEVHQQDCHCTRRQTTISLIR